VLEGILLVVVGFGASGSVGASLTSRAHPVEAMTTATTSTVTIRKCVFVRTSILLTGYQEDTPPLLRLPRQAVSYDPLPYEPGALGLMSVPRRGDPGLHDFAGLGSNTLVGFLGVLFLNLLVALISLVLLIR
jgi:hypothetical protein